MKNNKKLSSLPPLVGSMDMRTARPAPKMADQFYLSSEWRSLVATIIKQRGRKCQRCGETHDEDGRSIRVIGDHIVERKDGGSDLDPGNIQLICWPCHNAKTASEKRKRMWS